MDTLGSWAAFVKVLDRYRGTPQDLDLREACAIFRLSAKPFRRMNRDWPTAIKTGLSLVADVLARVR